MYDSVFHEKLSVAVSGIIDPKGPGVITVKITDETGNDAPTNPAMLTFHSSMYGTV